MTHPSPLHPAFADLGVDFLPWGPPDTPIPIALAFDEPAIEYAAARKAAALADLPALGIVEITGSERGDFLDRMLTRRISTLQPRHAARALWLGRTGRIAADLLLLELGDRALALLDSLDVPSFIESLSSYLFAEEVALADRTADLHAIALHGPAAAELLARHAETLEGPPPTDLPEAHAALLRIGGARVTALRDDATGTPGFLLIAPAASVPDLWSRFVRDEQSPARPLGWAAFNVARIEAGRPLFRVDYGPDSLPHETGIVRDLVAFDQRCYLGQEIVARMESRGHPKQLVVGLDVEGEPDETGLAPLPETGAAIFARPNTDSDTDKPIGAVTSSTISPMRSGRAIALAMIRYAHTTPGTELFIELDADTRIRATVRETLRSLPTPRP